LKLRSAELITYQAGARANNNEMTDMDAALAKLAATEALAFIADEAIQIHGGMGLMADLPLERIWRDARVERIWEGTSEIQRLIISRSILRPLENA
jgi:acyl-CoA dehydrogenase